MTHQSYFCLFIQKNEIFSWSAHWRQWRRRGRRGREVGGEFGERSFVLIGSYNWVLASCNLERGTAWIIASTTRFEHFFGLRGNCCWNDRGSKLLRPSPAFFTLSSPPIWNLFSLFLWGSPYSNTGSSRKTYFFQQSHSALIMYIL